MPKVKTQINIGTLGDQYLLSITRLNVKTSAILCDDELDELEAQIKKVRAIRSKAGGD